MPGNQIVWLEYEGRREPVAIVRTAGDPEQLSSAAKAWSEETPGVRYSVVLPKEASAAESTAHSVHRDEEVLTHPPMPKQPQGTRVTLSFGKAEEDDWSFHPAEIGQLEQRDFVLTKDGHDEAPRDNGKNWPVIQGDRVIWADDGEFVIPIAIVAIPKRDDSTVLAQVAELFGVRHPSLEVVVGRTRKTVPEHDGFPHFLRFLLLYSACVLSIGGLLLGLAYLLRRTGYRRRDAFLLFVPLLGPIIGSRAAWRFTSSDQYWEPRNDEPSVTMFDLDRPPSAIILGASGVLVALLVVGGVVAWVGNRSQGMSCSDWQAGSQIAASRDIGQFMAQHPYPPPNGAFAVVQNGYWVWNQPQMIIYQEGQNALRGYFTDASGRRFDNPC